MSVSRSEVLRSLGALPQHLPWLERFDATLREDSLGEPAIEVQLVARAGIRDLFEDGEQLSAARHLVRELLEAEGIELWPYVSFLSADEVSDRFARGRRHRA